MVTTAFFLERRNAVRPITVKQTGTQEGKRWQRLCVFNKQIKRKFKEGIYNEKKISECDFMWGNGFGHDDRMWVWREASACLPCAVQCTTMIECMPLHMAQSNGTTTIECGCGERDCFDAGPRIPTPPRGRFPPPPRGCTPSSPVFYPAAKTAISF